MIQGVSFFFLNHEFRIDAVETALGVFGALANVFVFAIVELLETFGFTFGKIIFVDFVAEIVEDKAGDDNESDEPNERFENGKHSFKLKNKKYVLGINMV